MNTRHPPAAKARASSPASPSAWAARSVAPRPPATAWSSPSAKRSRNGHPRRGTPRASSRASATSPSTPIRSTSSSAAPSSASPAGTRTTRPPTPTQEGRHRLDELLSITDRFGGIDKARPKNSGYEVLPGDAWLEQDVDILIPAALENQITADNVGQDQPTSQDHRRGRQRPDDPRSGRGPRGARHLRDPRLPGQRRRRDLQLLRAGPVQHELLLGEGRGPQQARHQDDGRLHRVSELARKRKLYMRDAAYIIAVDRVAQGLRLGLIIRTMIDNRSDRIRNVASDARWRRYASDDRIQHARTGFSRV
jgi:hypothetical protein